MIVYNQKSIAYHSHTHKPKLPHPNGMHITHDTVENVFELGTCTKFFELLLIDEQTKWSEIEVRLKFHTIAKSSCS